MFPLGKLLGAFMLQRSLSSDTAHFQRFLEEAGKFILMAVVTAFMVGALLIGALYAARVALMDYGLTHEAATLTVAAVAIVMTLAMVSAMNAQLQRMKLLLHKVLRQQSPLAAPLGSLGAIGDSIRDTADAFLRGWDTRTRRSTRSTRTAKPYVPAHDIDAPFEGRPEHAQKSARQSARAFNIVR